MSKKKSNLHDHFNSSIVFNVVLKVENEISMDYDYDDVSEFYQRLHISVHFSHR